MNKVIIRFRIGKYNGRDRQCNECPCRYTMKFYYVKGNGDIITISQPQNMRRNRTENLRERKELSPRKALITFNSVGSAEVFVLLSLCSTFYS